MDQIIFSFQTAISKIDCTEEQHGLGEGSEVNLCPSVRQEISSVDGNVMKHCNVAMARQTAKSLRLKPHVTSWRLVPLSYGKYTLIFSLVKCVIFIIKKLRGNLQSIGLF